jgi:DNA-binding response OmpR family regulator
MTAQHILLVEDEIKLARFIELELESEGYRVSVAHDGMSGLSLARESEPDSGLDDARADWGRTLSATAIDWN